MAEIRPPSLTSAPIVPQRITPASRLEAARRAFFQAAVDPSPTPVQPQAAAQSPQPAVKPQDGQRYARPGSIVDIKV